METSDDPISALFALFTPAGTGALAVAQTAALATGAYAAGGGFSDKGGGGYGGMPSVEAEQATKTATAEPVAQLSEQAKKTRRLRASMLTRDWGKPTLGYAGLLGG